jgi:hypothetical protein
LAPATKNPFDSGQLRNFLGGWYDMQMSTALRKPRTSADLEKHGGTVFDIQPEMASTKAVRVLLELRDLLGFEPSKDVIKKGGYRNKAEFISEMTARIEEACKSYRTVKPGAIPKSQKREEEGHAQL